MGGGGEGAYRPEMASSICDNEGTRTGKGINPTRGSAKSPSNLCVCVSVCVCVVCIGHIQNNPCTLCNRTPNHGRRPIICRKKNHMQIKGDIHLHQKTAKSPSNLILGTLPGRVLDQGRRPVTRNKQNKNLQIKK